jgi:hypothetical protein
METYNRPFRSNVFVALVLLLGVYAFGIAVRAQESGSERLARELQAAMTHQGLTAYAVKDPDAADTFIAAMLFPEVQLLVVSGRPTAPAAAEAQLNQKQYADVYAMLHQAVAPESKWFVQDLKADGLHAKAPDTADIVYEHVTTQLVFDGTPDKRHLSQTKYNQQFEDAERRYSRLLTALVNGLKGSAQATAAN